MSHNIQCQDDLIEQQNSPTVNANCSCLYSADKQPIALRMEKGPPNSCLMGSFSYLAIKKHQGNGQVKPGVVHHSTFKKPWGGDQRAGAQRWNPPHTPHRSLLPPCAQHSAEEWEPRKHLQSGPSSAM